MKASNNPYPSILVDETTAPSAPAAATRRLYVDANHVLRWIDSGSLDSPLSALNKWDAAVAPTVNEDSGDGYSVGSRWINTTADKEYVCLDSTVGAAVWTETTASGGGGAIGNSSLVYRYTVTGSDKASIDTGVDTPDAGANDWTNGDLLEVFALLRTDDAAGTANVDWTVNNDTTSGNYVTQFLYGIGVTAGAGELVSSGTAWPLTVHGSGGTAGYPSVQSFDIPGYANTTFNKVGSADVSTGDATSLANHYAMRWAVGWTSTAAITRMKVAAQGGAKLKIGSQLLIYKRLAS